MLGPSPLDMSHCSLCANPYDELTYIPKLLPCGHTQCSFCVAHSRTDFSHHFF